MACSSSSSDEPTLRLWAMGREGEVVSQLLPGFEKENPRIKVQVQQIPWTAAHEKLLTAFVGEATPDIAMLGNTWVPEFVALDALEPLDSRVATSKELPRSDYFQGIWDTNTVDSVTYGIPWYVDTRVIFYRSDLLANAGCAQMPSTWATWRDCMVRVKSKMNDHQYPLLIPITEWPPPVILGLQAGSPILIDNGRYGGFSKPPFMKGFDFYVSLFRDKLAPPFAASEISNLYQEFERGNIAMYISGPWQIGEFSNRLPKNMQDKWMTATLPGENGPGVSLAGGASLSLFRGSKHKAEAWKLMEYLSRPDVQIEFHKLTGDLPARRTAWSDSVLSQNKYMTAFREQLERTVPTPKVPEWEQIATKVFEHGERAVRGKQTPLQAMQALDRDVNVILDKRRWLMDHKAGK
ncbi:MAG TPA: sugar ABC transporter substrate-binding protein [Gemmatimonadaceae bacterium]|jgi:multiple sugar transport system substrate-binding protein|nr:sugar ABC transporter substrate-binding protein [Gemmatimonadaceae bacterium]